MSTPVSFLFGGRSSEHDASLASLRNVYAIIRDDERFTVGTSYFWGRERGIYRVEAGGGDLDDQLRRHGEELTPNDVAKELRLSGRFAINLLHGQKGEDGSLSGWADIHGLHGSFGSLISESLGMNKWASGILAPTLSSLACTSPVTWIVRTLGDLPDPGEIGRRAPMGIVIKPGELGASLLSGFYTEWSHERCISAISQILEYSSTALVQEFVPGHEYSCGVVERDGVGVSLPVFRVAAPGGFYGHDAKHSASSVARLEPEESPISSLVAHASVRLFRELSCFGWARFDFIFSRGHLYFLEFNSMPGLSRKSLFPRMLAVAGEDVGDLIQGLVLASARRKQLKHVIRYSVRD